MRQIVNGILFIVPSSLVLLGLLGGPFFSQATGGYLVGGGVMVALALVGVGAGFYYLAKGLAGKPTE